MQPKNRRSCLLLPPLLLFERVNVVEDKKKNIDGDSVEKTNTISHVVAGVAIQKKARKG